MRSQSARSSFVAASLVAGACGLLGCEARVSSGTGAHAEVWDTAWEYKVTLEDTSLLTPTWLASFRGGVIVGDGNQPRLTAFDSAGDVRWIYAPRVGDGPGEMLFPVDAVEQDDSLWVLAFPPRLLLISPEGTFVRQLPVEPPPSGFASGLGALPTGQLQILMGTTLKTVSTADGSLVRLDSLPWVDAPPDDWFRQLSMDSNRGVTAVGMTLGPQVVLLEHGALRGSVVLPDRGYRLRKMGMDPPDPPLGFGAWQTRLVDAQLWIVTGGTFGRVPAPNDRLLIFTLDGAQLSSRQLPFDTGDLAADDEYVFLLESGDEPTILALRRP